MLTIYEVQSHQSVMQFLLKLAVFFFSQEEMCVRRRGVPQFLEICGSVLRSIEVSFYFEFFYYYYFYSLRVIFKQIYRYECKGVNTAF